MIGSVYRFTIFILLCWGAHAWFTWQWDLGYSTLLAEALASLIAFVYGRSYHVKLISNNTIMLAGVLLFAASFWQAPGIRTIFHFAFRYYPIWVFISDNKNFSQTINYICKCLAVVLFAGLVLHIIMLATSTFPSFVVTYPNDNESYIFFCYLFLIRKVFEGSDFGVRFMSIFLEPGYLGTLMAFMLYALKFDFKNKAVPIMIVALAFSLSLAGYITAFVGYLFHLASERKSITKYVVYAVLVLVSLNVAQTYNNGHNPVNELILDRLQTDEEKYISGNNRFGLGTDYYFDSYLNSGQILTGIGLNEVQRINLAGKDSRDFEIYGAGYKVFLIRDGIIGALLYLFFYLVLGLWGNRGNRRYMGGFVTLIAMTFIQAGYPSSYSWIIPFAIGYTQSLIEQKNNHQRR